MKSYLTRKISHFEKNFKCFIFSGGWGYEPKFRKVKTELEGRFPGKVEIVGDKIPGITGKFEVELENGTVLHSKINGDGYVDTPAKMDKIAKGIESALG